MVHAGMTRQFAAGAVALGMMTGMMTGCATIFTGHKESDPASRTVLARLDSPETQTSRERYRKLSGHFENFGVVDTGLYRGAQFDLDQLWRLREAGIVTVIDFRKPEDGAAAEAIACREAGLTHYNFPWSGHEENIDPDMVRRFLDIVRHRTNRPVYVHCKRGAERTGTMIAVYRIEQDGWSAEEAYAEMKQFRFRSFWFRNLKEFVLDYDKGVAGP